MKTEFRKSNRIRKNKFILVFAFLGIITVNNAIAQDIVVKRTGEEIETKVLEIGINEVKYKKFDNETGPTYTIPKSEVFMIKYSNGSKDVFTDVSKTTPVETNTQYTEKLPAEEKQPIEERYVESESIEELDNPYKFRMYIFTGSGHSCGVLGASVEARFNQFGIQSGIGWSPNIDIPSWAIGVKYYFWKNLYISSLVGVIGEYYEYNYSYNGYYSNYSEYYDAVFGATEMFGVNWSWGGNVRFGVNLGVGFAFGFNYDLFTLAYDVGISVSFGTK